MAEPAAAPTCSVVIAAYNAEATIGQALDSVLQQTMRDFEVIVVDDGSHDCTAEQVERYLSDRRVRLHRQPNSGPAAARNAGIALSSGRFVSMLDSDDLWMPRYLESMVEALEKGRAGFAFTRAWTLDRTSNRIRRDPWSAEARAVDDAHLLRALVEANFVFTAITVRREVLQAAGGYDEELRASEDYDLSLRIAALGHGAAYVPGPLCIRGDRPGSLTKSNRRMMDGKRRALAKLLTSPAPAPDVLRALNAQLGVLERELAGGDRESLRSALRRTLGGATRDWRRRHGELGSPPAEVAAAFPELGNGWA